MGELYQEQASSPVTSRAHQRYLAVTGVMGYSTLWQPCKDTGQSSSAPDCSWMGWLLWSFFEKQGTKSHWKKNSRNSIQVQIMQMEQLDCKTEQCKELFVILVPAKIEQ